MFCYVFIIVYLNSCICIGVFIFWHKILSCIFSQMYVSRQIRSIKFLCDIISYCCMQGVLLRVSYIAEAVDISQTLLQISFWNYLSNTVSIFYFNWMILDHFSQMIINILSNGSQIMFSKWFSKYSLLCSVQSPTFKQCHVFFFMVLATVSDMIYKRMSSFEVLYWYKCQRACASH